MTPHATLHSGSYLTLVLESRIVGVWISPSVIGTIKYLSDEHQFQVAQWIEHRDDDTEVAGSNPDRGT